MLRNVLMLTAALVAASASGPLAAHPLHARPLVQLAVLDRDSGQWLPEYPYRGDRWVAGTPGHRYAVRLTNTSDERVLVVLSVDGVNAVSGETADPSQAGYVLAPWQSTEVEGWRKSLDDVAQFVFTDLPDSYAARTGRPDNVGVLGIAVFREARPLPPPPPVAPMLREDARGALARNQAKAAAPTAADAAVELPQRLGTGHGDREWSPVQHTQFVRASMRPDQVLQLRYDDIDALAAAGIVPRPLPPWRASGPAPQAFPGGFVPDPPNG
jgi:hypothetical protein|nr:hypothetical protein [Lysobacter telluris]